MIKSDNPIVVSVPVVYEIAYRKAYVYVHSTTTSTRDRRDSNQIALKVSGALDPHNLFRLVHFEFIQTDAQSTFRQEVGISFSNSR